MAKKKENNKVLISFLGTGPFQKNGSKREYNKAHYRLGDDDLGEYPFVASALMRHYNAKKVVLVGTVHSMWEEVYRWFSEDKGLTVDEDTYIDIADACTTACHTSRLQIPHRKDIEQVLGDGSRVVLVRYGLKEWELRENMNIILGLQDMLNDGDELIVDITHSFRSLPIFMMNLLIYLQNVSTKHIKISHIHYGMLEMIRELGYAPIIDLCSILKVNEWITGAADLMHNGNAYAIASLLRSEGSVSCADMANQLVKFSDLKNLNNIRGYRSNMRDLNIIMDSKDLMPDLGRAVIPDVIEEFITRFGQQERDDLFRWKMAKWHYERKNYSLAFVNLVEAVVSLTCLLLGYDGAKRNHRNEVRSILSFKGKKLYHELTAKERPLDRSHERLVETLRRNKILPAEYLKHYHSIQDSRNAVAHENDDRDYQAELSALQDAMTFFGNIVHISEDDLRVSKRPAAAAAEAAKAQKVAQTEPAEMLPPVFINFSNHPSSSWGEEQMRAAQAMGEVIDEPYPNVPPKASARKIGQLAEESVRRILELAAGRPLTVHVMGEMTLCHAVVMRLIKRQRVRCVASTTERIVTEADGKKITEFHFVQFREY